MQKKRRIMGILLSEMSDSNSYSRFSVSQRNQTFWRLMYSCNKRGKSKSRQTNGTNSPNSNDCFDFVQNLMAKYEKLYPKEENHRKKSQKTKNLNSNSEKCSKNLKIKRSSKKISVSAWKRRELS